MQHSQYSLKKICFIETTCKNNVQVDQASFQSRENPTEREKKCVSEEKCG